ncbi:MAG: heat-inducible transcription repressor HrcA [Anaerolineales bacterium]|nr:heat-inducible transcription repressor HrcA [Anaerolineales bacterium]
MPDELIPLDALSERQRRVLSIVIQEYVDSAQPVGSAVIVAHHDLGVSPATIRNDLAALERLGLLTHPHISAGRVPTELGFRFYVHHLLAEPALAATEQNAIRHEFGRVRQDIDQWLRVGTAVLARTSHGAALATAPRATRSRFKHMELVHIHTTKVLLVLVLQDGAVKQQVLDLDDDVEQGELSRISNELNAHLVGSDAASIRLTYAKLSPFACQVAALVLDTMQRLDDQGSGQLYRDGLTEVLSAPEFAEGQTVRKIVQVLEHPSIIEQLVGDYPARNAVHVVIAGDGRYEALRDMSIVLAHYGIGDQVTGVLGVVGPVRMGYGRTIGAVRFVSNIMSEMVEDIYGS